MDALAEAEVAVRKVEGMYPDGFAELLANNHQRMTWQVAQVLDLAPVGSTVIDLGAGAAPFMAACQVLGYNTIVADDYKDEYYADREMASVITTFRELGVTVKEGDIFEPNFADDLPPLDVVTSHDSLEHWHNSPKTLLHTLWARMTDTGVMWIGAPNSANLRKRIAGPLGKAKWSAMADWYEQPVFRGHVREPDVEDLRYIGEDLGARKIRIDGRNWIAHRHRKEAIRRVAPTLDRVLASTPSLCTDLYLYAYK